MINLSFGSTLGSLCLNKQGELSFESILPDAEDSGSFFKRPFKTEQADDASTVLDGASGILSQGGGYAFSVRSGFLSNISSVNTPKSFFSKRSATT